MAATSPYLQNDYQALSTFRPYRLPVNDVFKAITAQDEFWRAGAMRVKSVYQNALDLKLSKEENRDIRDNYIREAQNQLTKLSTQNLADPSVQRQGFDLFKPLFQDEGIMSDDQATRHIDRVNTDAMRYRNTDGGKYYSSDNHQYALTGAAEFMNSTDRKAGLKYLQNKKDYEPFYDYTAEYDKIIKNCPSSTDEGTGVVNGTGYMKTVSIKERSQGKVSTCLEAGLSQKAYRQMQIEGSMRYRNNPDILRADYADYLSGHSSNMSQQMQTLSGQLEGIKNNKTLTEEQKAAATGQLNKQIDALQNELINSNAIIGRLNVGDNADIAGHEETIAGTLYQYRKVLKESYAAAFREQKVDFKADPVQMQQLKFKQDIQLKNIDFTNDAALRKIDFNYDVALANLNNEAQYNLELMKEMNKGSGSAMKIGADGKLTINSDLIPVAGNFTDVPDKVDQFGIINDKIAVANKTIDNNETTLFNSFIRRGDSDPAFRDRLTKAFNTTWDNLKANGNNFVLEGGKTGKFSETFWFQNYIKQNPNDPDMRKWNEINSGVQVSSKALGLQLEQGEDVVATRLGIKKAPGETGVQATARYVRESIGTLPSVNVNGTKVTAEDVQNAIEHKGGRVQIQYDPSGTGIHYIVDGKEVNYKDWFDINKLHGKILLKNQDINKTIGDVRKEVYSTQQFQKDAWFYNVDDKSTPVQVLEGILGTHEDGKAPVKRGIQIEQLDFEGGFRVRIPNLSQSEFETLVKQYPTRDMPDRQGDIVTFKNQGYMKLPNGTSPIMKNSAYVLSVIANGADFQKAQPGQKISSGDIEFPMVDVSGNMGKLRLQVYKDVDGSPTYEVINATKGSKMNEFKDPFAVMKYLQTVNSTQ